MATWGDLNTVNQRGTLDPNDPLAIRGRQLYDQANQGGFFNRMTQPPVQRGNVPPKTPTSFAEALLASAGRNQSRFGPASNYNSRFTTTPGGHEQGNYLIDQKSPLRNITSLMQSNPFNLDAYHDSNGMLDETQFMSYNTIGGQPLYQKGEDGNWTINPNGRYGELNNQFKGLDFRIENDPYNDNKPKLVWNEDALPRDAFGGFGGGDVEGFEDGRNGTLGNRDMVYDDPFYGRITHPRNMQQHEDWFDRFNDMLGPILLSVAGMGLGGALGGAGLLGGGFSPSTMMSLGQGARGAMNGNIGSLLSSIASMGMGPLTGLSGMPLNLARSGTNMAISQLTRPRGGGRG